MLPYTIYNILESSEKQIEGNSTWLTVILDASLNAVHEELLSKICSALQADFKRDVQILELPGEEELRKVHIAQASKLIISFGVPSARLGIWIELEKPGMRTMESFTFILTVNIEALSKSPSAKKELWSHMQDYLDFKSKGR